MSNVKILFLARNKETNDTELLDYDNNPKLSHYAGWDFESFDQLSKALWVLTNKLHKHPDKEVAIDITSGQKPTSAAAVAITFNRDIHAQYVQTEDGYGVFSYDIVYESPEAGKLEL